MTFIKSHKGLIFVFGFIAVIAIVLVSIYASVNSIRGTAVGKETALVAQYKDNQQELSSYILTFNETLGIADRQSNKLNDILLDAVKGRYDSDTSLQPGTGGAMFSAISEAYPDLTATSETYANVQDLVVSGRNAYKNKQTKLLDMIKDYNTWTEEDLFRKFVLNSIVGAPTDNLAVTDAGKTYYGVDALEQISQLVLTQEAVDAYETGMQDPLIMPEAPSDQ
jgi:hypothetical protein